jgi:hypothetical protein
MKDSNYLLEEYAMFKRILKICVLIFCIVSIHDIKQTCAATVSEKDAIFKLASQLGTLTKECTVLVSKITDYGKKIESDDKKFYIYLITIEVRNLGYKAVLLADVIGSTQLASEVERVSYSKKVLKSINSLSFFEYDNIYSSIAGNLKDPEVISFVKEAKNLAGSLSNIQNKAKELLAKQLKE